MQDKPSFAADAAPKVDTFLENLKPDARRGFLNLRALLVSLGADVRENVEKDHVTYARARPFVEARLVRGRLVVAFPEGERLRDPEGRLLRKGSERHLRIEASDDLDAHMQGFVREAYVQARG